jgi:CelD/BcsL family acetyltransferase involved in cellulose biosynthesis
LKITKKRVFGTKIRCLEIIAAQTSNYQDLIIGKNSEDVLICILDYLLENRGLWDQIDLRHIPETSKTARFFLEKLGSYPLFRIAETEKCTYLALDKSWEEHKKSLGKHRRHRMTNNRGRIEREIGKIQLRTSLTDNQLISDLHVFFDLHQKRWNPTDTPSVFMDSRYQEFYTEAGLQLLPKGQFGLAILDAGDITLGCLLYFIFGRSILIQLVTYDPDYYKYSPIIVLMELFADEKLEDCFNEIDFGTYYSWKESWANQLKNRINLIIFPKRLLPFTIYNITRLYLVLRSKIRQHPHILNTIKITLRKARILK